MIRQENWAINLFVRQIGQKIDLLKTDRNKLELNFFDSIKVRISSYQKMENKSPVFIPLPFNSNNLKICSKIDNYVNESKCNH